MRKRLVRAGRVRVVYGWSDVHARRLHRQHHDSDDSRPRRRTPPALHWVPRGDVHGTSGARCVLCELSRDTYNVGIFTVAEWSNYSAGGQARAFAFRENVRTATEVADLPAGSYVLGFYCRNLIQRCDVTYALNANY
nr:hypothetical protein [Deltaproteobacteria bacterium]